MDKNLKTIQTFAKIAQVLCKIAWICSIVGVVGCAVGILSLLVGTDNVLKIGGVTIHGIIANESGSSTGTMYASMTVGLILSIGEFVLARFAERYFINELADGTPFTLTGASEMKRLGILTISIPLGAMIAAEIAYETMNHVFQDVADMHIDDFASVDLGIVFIVMSFVFRYGATLEKEKGKTEE